MKENYVSKMIGMVDCIKIGCIISKIINFKAYYYKVISVVSGCDNPDTDYQSKTIYIKFVGKGASAIPDDTKTIYDYSDCVPYAQFVVG